MITKLTIGTEKISIDINEILMVGDLSEDMDKVASQIGHYGALLGAAQEELTKVDGLYRNWRAKEAAAITKKDSKIPEHKVKAKIDSQETFVKYKTAKALCEKNVITLQNVIKALLEKSPNLRSRGARERAEFEATDMTTRTRDGSGLTQGQIAEQRKQALRDKK
jgi:hypothetical protein